jgi:hypothetical protein
MVIHSAMGINSFLGYTNPHENGLIWLHLLVGGFNHREK